MGLKDAVRYALEDAGRKSRTDSNYVCRQTYYDILNDRQKRGATWSTILAISEEVSDRHRFAHLLLDLPDPGDMHLEDDLARLCQKIMNLSLEARLRLMGRIEGWIENEGGGITAESQVARTEYG